MAIPTLKTADRVRLVYTGDPSFGSSIVDSDTWNWRAATPRDVELGATVAVLRPLNGPERLACSIAGKGSAIAELIEVASASLVVVEGDARSPREILDSWPDRCRVSLGAAAAVLSGLPLDPFGQRSCG